MKRFCRVVVDSPVPALDRPFDYAIPERMLGRVAVGSVVRVPLHGRRMRGYVRDLLDEAAVASPSALSALVSPEPVFSPDTIALADWTAGRYVATTGAVLHQAVPGRYSAPAGDAPVQRRTRDARPPAWLEHPGRLASVCAGGAGVLVAPSPSAELEAVAGAAAAVRGGVLILAPRTSTADELAAAIPGAVPLHGELTPARRAAAWARARDAAAPVVAGGRAALFAPMRDLALVVVVAAHDRAHKAERAPRLHALDVGRRRAAGAGAGFLVTSVAPPLDLTGPQASAYTWLRARRSAETGLRTEIVSPRGGPVTERLTGAVRAAAGAGEDSLVFAARRGLALRVRCEECGWYPRCPACGTGLAVFGAGRGASLRCRSCGAGIHGPSTCPSCGGRKLGGVGWGSERLAAAIEGLGLPVPVLRVDRDSPLPRDRPSPAVIVGTQAALGPLAAGGLHTVCVADLDQLLGLPDFRAAERAFQTLQELAGLLRPEGRFVVQTREPDHHVVQAFVRRDYRFFAARELPARRVAGYPPFGSIVRVELDPDDAGALRAAARTGGGEVVGPLVHPSGRADALVRAPSVEPMLEPMRTFATKHPSARIDVDPVDVM